MRSPHAASIAAKLLICVALGSVLPMSAADAATKCPSGEILRVSLGVCVSKEHNRSLMTKHEPKKPKLVNQRVAPSSAPEPAGDSAASLGGRRARSPLIEVAERGSPPVAEQHPSAAPAPDNTSALSAFGSLFVGAFHSTMSMGQSAFK
jgi:hypothetical protein